VKRLVAALLGLFIILVVVGLLSKVGLGFLSLAAALLAMALAWFQPGDSSRPLASVWHWWTTGRWERSAPWERG